MRNTSDFERLDVNGRLMSAQEISRGLKIGVLAGAIGMGWFAVCFGVPTTMLVESLSKSGVVIGLIVTLQQISLVIQIPAALFFEQLPKRKKMWAIAAFAHRLLWFIPAFAPLLFRNSESVALALIFVSITLSSALGQFCGPIWQNWMADLIPKSISGKYWGLRQSIVTIPFLIATYASGYVLDLFPHPNLPGGTYIGFAIVFSCAAVIGMIDIAIHTLVPEPAHGLNIRHRNIVRRILEPIMDQDFRWMTLTFAAWNLALGLTGSFSLVYLKRNFNVSYTHLSLLAMTSSIGPVLFGILNGYLVDKIGARLFGAILFILNALIAMVWFFVGNWSVSFSLPLLGQITMPQPVLLLLIANFISGTLTGGLVITQFHMLNMLAPRDGRGMAIAVHWSVVGLMAAAGPLFGGIIMDYFTDNPIKMHLITGEGFSYFHVLISMYYIIAMFICAPLLMKVRTQPKEMKIHEVFRAVKVGNPLRAVTTVINIYQTAFDLETPASEK